MEVLRRDTLEWQPITVAGKGLSDVLTYETDDGRMRYVRYDTCLAVRGELDFKGYGMCSYCGRVMTKREFNKHTKIHAGSRCLSCSYCKESNRKLVKDKNGNLHKRTDLYCSRTSEKPVLSRDLLCTMNSCPGSFINIDKNRVKVPVFPKKILTIVAFKNWLFNRKDSKWFVFKHPRYGIYAYIDRNGYLMYFELRRSGFTGIYDFDTDKFISTSGNEVNISDRTRRALRRLYV